MKRLVSAVFIFCMFSGMVSAYEGLLSGEKNIRVIKTEWFDIIYPPESEKSAGYLAQHCDEINEEVCGELGIVPYARMPVVFAPASDYFNAFWTPVFYNRIVLYDTPVPADMAVFSENLLSTFRHECTHAVTYNMKNGFWRTVGKIFGDVVNPAFLFINPGLAEGASVSFESLNGEGRLNDPFSMQMVQQAKIEGKFPRYADVRGSRDLYPAGGYYYFGGEFASWLQTTYGMEKYAQFWYKCVNFQTITAGVCFKSVYGIWLNDAWAQFRESVDVPAVSENPLENNGYADFFAYINGKSSAKYTKCNKNGAVYTSLTVSNEGVAYIELKSGSVWYAARNKNGGYKKPKKLFTMAGIERIQLSADGAYLAVDFTSYRHAVQKTEIRLYNVKSGSWYYFPGTGYRDAAVCYDGINYFLAAVRTESQDASLVIFKVTENKTHTRVIKTEQFSETVFPAGDVPFSITCGGGSSFAYLYKTRLDFSIRVYDVAGGTTAVYSVPAERISLRDLSLAANGKIKKTYLFSWAVPGTMPRLGELVTDGTNGTFLLQTEDVSGGVHTPVALRTSDGHTAAYTGAFYADKKLLAVNTDTIVFQQMNVQAACEAENKNEITAENTFSETQKNSDAENLSAAESTRYNPFAYYLRGLLLPFAIEGPHYVYDIENEVISGIYALGASYVSTNPWSDGILILSGGFDGIDTGGGSISIQHGTATSLFSWKVSGELVFSEQGFESTYENVSISSAVPVFNHSYFIFSNKNELLHSYENDSTDEQKTLYRNHIFGSERSAAQFTSIYRSGPGWYEKSGLALTCAYDFVYKALCAEDFSWKNVYQNINVIGKLQMPRMLPIDCNAGFTYNLPFSITGSLYPSEGTFVKFDGNTVLFASEIQKAVPFIPALFVNRIALGTGYAGYFQYNDTQTWDIVNLGNHLSDLTNGRMEYRDNLYAEFALTITPNVGEAATTSLTTELKARFQYTARKTQYASPFSVALYIDLVY